MVTKSKIHTLDLKQEYKFLKKEINKQLAACLDSQQWILGSKVSEFEKKASQYLGVKYTLGVGSGTDALIISLRALALKLKKKEYFDQKDEIITTPFTFVATAEAIVRSGAKPVFVDINPNTFNIDPQEIKKAVTKNTVGILPVHLYGLSCHMNEISKIAKKYSLFIVEDCAQSFGASFRKKKLGTLGDCGAFSFFPSKNLGCFGDGGLMATNDKSVINLARSLRSHGQTKIYNASFIGYNSRLDSIQAAVLLAKLKNVNKFNNFRRNIAKKYNKVLGRIKQVQIPSEFEASQHVYHQYTIKASQRDALLGYLNSKGIGARIYYPTLLPEMKAFRKYKCKLRLENAKQTSLKVMSLPIYPFLKESDIGYITSVIKRFYHAL